MGSAIGAVQKRGGGGGGLSIDLTEILLRVKMDTTYHHISFLVIYLILLYRDIKDPNSTIFTTASQS